MRILLAHNSLYYPSHGGGDKSNRLLMEALARRGHQVRVVARVEKFGEEGHRQLLRDLSARDVHPEVTDYGVRFCFRSVDVRVVSRTPALRSLFAAQIQEFQPEIILTSTDDPGQILFDVAVKSEARVVHLVRATIAVPFGPDASAPSTSKTELLSHADLIVGVSEYVAGYVREHGGIDAVHVPISLMDSMVAPYLGRFENLYVTMVNPCAVKGIDIFVPLAESMPDVAFAAVPSWGTTDADVERVAAVPNITLLDPADNIDELLIQTRVLLVPSVWAEARSRVIVEAMSRGVPVIASRIGGIVEAKLGVDYLVPVSPIKHYKPSLNERLVPIADVPPQDIAPWREALTKLTTDQAEYERVSMHSRDTALRYIGSLSIEPFERLLLDILDQPKKTHAPHTALSAEKRKLLSVLVKQRSIAKGDPWLVWNSDPKSASIRLICFPHAGGGTQAFRSWRFPDCAVGAMRLPGRESRLQEPVIDDFRQLIERLTSELHLDTPFAFYGQSMGAVIAFELARRLRRQGLPLPSGLYVAAARAPQFRLDHKPAPEPTDDEFVAELRRLEGMPADVLDNPSLLALAMPALRGDARLYRNYIFLPEDPLPVPIFAYGGEQDPNIQLAHVEAWRDQTSATFVARQFRGGHFFPQTEAEIFLPRLAGDFATLAK